MLVSPSHVFLRFVFKTDAQGRYYLHVTDKKDLESLKVFSELVSRWFNYRESQSSYCITPPLWTSLATRLFHSLVHSLSLLGLGVGWGTWTPVHRGTV